MGQAGIRRTAMIVLVVIVALVSLRALGVGL